jgi:hypothetical protein
MRKLQHERLDYNKMSYIYFPGACYLHLASYKEYPECLLPERHEATGGLLTRLD